MNALKTASVLCEVSAEREAQDTKWGEQNHPSFRRGKVYSFPDEDKSKHRCDDRAANGEVAYADILIEEVAEVGETRFADLLDTDARTRAELVQVAAVAVAWIEAIDRRAKDAAP